MYVYVYVDVYVYVKFSPENLNPDLYSPTPHKHLYLWNNHHVEGAQ